LTTGTLWHEEFSLAAGEKRVGREATLQDNGKIGRYQPFGEFVFLILSIPAILSILSKKSEPVAAIIAAVLNHRRNFLLAPHFSSTGVFRCPT
jgi:hypothetical protein